jgi:hypothetical protein
MSSSLSHIFTCDNCGKEEDTYGFRKYPHSWIEVEMTAMNSQRDRGLKQSIDLCGECVVWDKRRSVMIKIMRKLKMIKETK